MSLDGDTRARDRAHADELIREVCDEFDTALEAAANGAVSERYAAVPSWYAPGASPARPARPHADIPSWCIDAPTARRLLGEIHRSDQRSDQ